MRSERRSTSKGHNSSVSVRGGGVNYRAYGRRAPFCEQRLIGATSRGHKLLDYRASRERRRNEWTKGRESKGTEPREGEAMPFLRAI